MPIRYPDPIHGMIVIPDKYRTIIESDPLSRLKNIKQLGLTVVSYPGAVHTRFEHTIGTFYMINKILDLFNITDKSLREKYNMSTLLSEIGILPLSYSTRPIFKKINMDKKKYAELIYDSFLHQNLQLNSEEKVEILNGCPESNSWFLNDFSNFSYLTPVKLASTIDYVLRDSYYTGRYKKLYDLRYLLSLENFDTYHGKLELEESLHELHRAVYALDAIYGNQLRRFVTLILIRLVDKLIELEFLCLSKYSEAKEFIDLDDNRFLFELENAVNAACQKGHSNLQKMFNLIRQQLPIQIYQYPTNAGNKDKTSNELEVIISKEKGAEPNSTFVLGINRDVDVGYRMFGKEFKDYKEAISSDYFTQLTGLNKGIDKTGLDDPDFVYYITV